MCRRSHNSRNDARSWSKLRSRLLLSTTQPQGIAAEMGRGSPGRDTERMVPDFASGAIIGARGNQIEARRRPNFFASPPAFALIGKEANGRKLGLTEEKRFEVADPVIRGLRTSPPAGASHAPGGVWPISRARAETASGVAVQKSATDLRRVHT